MTRQPKQKVLNGEQDIKKGMEAIRVAASDPAFSKSTQEQIQRAREGTVSANLGELRERLLEAAGIRRRRSRADNVLWIGCISCFGQIQLIGPLLKLYDALDVDYTILDQGKEYCCGGPWIHLAVAQEASQAEIEDARAAARVFQEKNLKRAVEMGGKRVVYFCQGCMFNVQIAGARTPLAQEYHLDLVAEAIEGRRQQLHLSDPTVIGYYEGCGRRYAPIGTLRANFSAWRRMLEKVGNLEVRELNSNICCVTNSASVLSDAERNGVKTIVTPMACCHEVLHRRESFVRGFQVKMVHELVLEAAQQSGGEQKATPAARESA